MAQLPVPEQLDMEATDISIRWPIWKEKWGHYYAATELEKKIEVHKCLYYLLY